MKLRQFLDAGYALLLEEYLRIGVPLQNALENMQKWTAGFSETDENEVRPTGTSSANDQALATLQARLAGIQGAPKV